MASPLNNFRSIVTDVTTNPQLIYTCPAETTGIVLLAQATNINSTDAGSITFYTVIGTDETELVKDFTIPVNDAAGLLSGKLVVEEGHSIGCYANADSTLKLTLSILETK
jgi:hypothetical protein